MEPQAPPAPGRRTLLALLVGATLVLGGGVYYFFGPPGDKAAAAAAERAPANGRNHRGEPPGGRIQPVTASEARIGDLDVVVTALGTVTASNTATVKPRVDGQLVRIDFREGQLVKAGDVLAEIDPRPFQVQVDQARGQRLRDEALLASAEVDLARYQGLLAKDSIAKQQVDTQAALVRQYRGAVEADKAQEASARLQLEFTRIRAPASGRLGLRQVDVGNMVSTGDAAGIVVITQTQPIYVVFAIPADNLAEVASRVKRGDTLAVEAWSSDGRQRLASGRLLSVDNQIDVATGTVKLKAQFDNKDDGLFPNQFVNARLHVATRRDSVLLPAAAVQRNAQGSYVYAIDRDHTVALRPVKLGPASGELTVIEQGLSAGERVVLDGADKLRPGAKVDVLAVDGHSLAGEDAVAGGKAAAKGGTRPRGRRVAEGGARQ